MGISNSLYTIKANELQLETSTRLEQMTDEKTLRFLRESSEKIHERCTLKTLHSTSLFRTKGYLRSHS
jgi:hypothetical protein